MAIMRDAGRRKYRSRLESASGKRKRVRSRLSKQKNERSHSESHSDTIVIEPIPAKDHTKINTFAGVGDVAT